MPVPKAPIYHHYVPQCLLRNLTNNDECFYCYDKRADKIIYDLPKNVFEKKHLYSTISYEDGGRDASLEIDWTPRLDGELAALVGRMMASVRANALPRLSDREKERWDFLYAFSARRLPSYNDMMVDGFKRRWTNWFSTFAKENTLTADEIEKFGSPEVAWQNAVVADLPDPPDILLNQLDGCGLVFGRLQNTVKVSWIIASHPFLYCPSGNHCWLPLAPDIAVSPCKDYPGGNERIVPLSASMVEVYNFTLFKQSDLVAAPSQELLEDLVRVARSQEADR